jgi:hypothetical protein
MRITLITKEGRRSVIKSQMLASAFGGLSCAEIERLADVRGGHEGLIDDLLLNTTCSGAFVICGSNLPRKMSSIVGSVAAICEPTKEAHVVQEAGQLAPILTELKTWKYGEICCFFTTVVVAEFREVLADMPDLSVLSVLSNQRLGVIWMFGLDIESDVATAACRDQGILFSSVASRCL